MKIGLRILLGYFLIVGLAAWLLLNVFVDEIKPGVRASMEDTLIDTSQLLAELVAPEIGSDTPDFARLRAHMQAYRGRSVDIGISGVNKRSLDYRIYVTDLRGMVVFDSHDLAVGQDYSKWNDVYLTLKGKYGARSTRADPADELSTVMYVAAPILNQGKLAGVLTVAKPNSTVQPFIERSKEKILRRSGWPLVAALLVGIGFSLWLSHSLRRLQRYAAAVEGGHKVALPALGNNEIGALGRALEAMRVKLEGKQYVEELMHTLAHELKSPIAAIQGSAELLGEDMPSADRQRFLANIIEQNQRQKQLIDKLLALIRLEKQQVLASVAPVDLRALLAQVEADAATRMAARGLRLDTRVDALAIEGDALLLRQALGNLLDNAIDFAPPGSTLELATSVDDGWVTVGLRDRGPGIPDYAAERIFERFYSLARPGGVKSTGLGLPFVREVALLHGGKVSVVNGADGGAWARLQLPR